MIFFEREALKVLGKKVNDPSIIRFSKSLSEKPKIDGGPPEFPGDDGADYYFLRSGIMLMFRGEDNILRSIIFYFSPEERFERFSGFYNLAISESSTKKSIMKRFGTPARGGNVTSYSYGRIIQKWMYYDYEKYTLRCEFHGGEDKLAKVSLMTPENAPGRIL